MISLVLSFAVLIGGYALYGRFVDAHFRPDDRPTPAIAIADGVDCVPLRHWKAFLVQLLNIAGTGPIFGALMGARFGPVVFLWIIFGSVLGGAVHDYMTGMISCRHEGRSIAELSGLYLGRVAKWLMRFFSLLLLVLVGTVFITSPAELLAWLTPEVLTRRFWVVVIIVYYLLATLLPIDKLIGRLYPVFGMVLLAMAGGILGCLLFSGNYTLPELTLRNMNPDGEPVWPYMFVTVACGAVSGFHSTQSPMIAKCVTHEKEGRSVFYGAMITEAAIALVWAAAGVAFYGTTSLLSDALKQYGQSRVVYDIAFGMTGTVGGVLAVIGVIVCPITSGDTAFRSARLILAEWTGLEQRRIKNRLILTIPLLLVGAILTGLDFDILWRYFSWSNQTLAMIALWMSTVYMIRKGEKRYSSLITAIPAAFMTAVTVTYILMAKEGFRLPAAVGYSGGAAVAVCFFSLYLIYMKKRLARNHS